MPGAYNAGGIPGAEPAFADLYYNRYRDYDPTTGRYIQADPIGLAGGSNPYSYAMGNPLRYTDPTGEFVPLLVIGFLVGFDANLIYQRFQGKGPWQPWEDDNCIDDDIDFWEAAEWGIVIAPLPKAYQLWKYGREFSAGQSGFKGAPFGNRNPNRPPHLGDFKWPHYHQPGPKLPDGSRAPGHSPKRHRPWEKSPADSDWRDRLWPKGVWPR